MSLVATPVPMTGLPVNLPVQTHQIESLLWNWLLPALVVIGAVVVAIGAGRGVALLKNEAPESPRQSLRYLLRGLVEAVVYIGILSGTLFLWHLLQETRGVDMILRFGSAMALMWAGFVVMDAFERHLYGRFHSLGRPSAVTVIPLLDKVAKVTWGLLIFLMFLDNMGMNVKALLAGLGVGGLAVALAGQKTIENLFGGLVLVLDQPVRAGDFCGFGDKQGEVVEIGLRSIKLRTADRTLISVPNGEFSQLVLENFARRDRIRFDNTFTLRLDTGMDAMKRVVDAFEAVLQADPRIDTELSRRARFIQVSTNSLDVEVFCYFNGSDWEEFMVWRQGLLLSLMGAMEREGGRLASPVQSAVPGLGSAH
ncbi:MAG TPA: mechanosensitive ion channel domain-containing protein [bacterium]|jgi:MscS family membrane protein|nr:mechanosensitive ion channel domain-containing protein [bacterium]